MPIPWQKRSLPHRGSLVIRPLSKGMNLAGPSPGIAPDEFLDINGFMVTQKGLVKFPPFRLLNGTSGDSTVASRPMNLARTVDAGNSERSFLLCAAHFYQVREPTQSLLAINWEDDYTFSVTVVAGSPITITTAATVTVGATAYAISFDLTLLIKVGDVIVNNTSGDTFSVTAVAPQTLTVTRLTGSTTGATTNWSVRRIASVDYSSSNPQQVLDWFYYGGDLYITGYNFPLGKVNTTASPMEINSVVPIAASSFGYPVFSTLTNNKLGTFSAKTACYFLSWVWMGNTEERSNVTDTAKKKYLNRIRWSDPFAPVTDFTDNTSYIDLSFTPGEILKLLPNGEQLIVYKTDAVLYGYPSNIPGLPLAFKQFDTGGIGLVGQRAVAESAMGHFFVGQNNIYFLSQQGIQPIGTPVLRRTIEECQYLSNVQVVHDTEKNCVYFGFPKDNLNIDEIWIFEYITRSWSYVKKSTNFIAGRRYASTASWDALAGTWDGLTVPTWDDYGASLVGFQFISESNLVMQRLDTFDGVPDIADEYSVVLETGDIDLDAADIVKTFLRFSIKINDDDKTTSAYVRSESINFQVVGSYDLGKNWRILGTLRVPVGKSEGHCNFRISGSTMRFRLLSFNEIPSYTIQEYTIDVNQSNPEQKGV